MIQPVCPVDGATMNHAGWTADNPPRKLWRCPGRKGECTVEITYPVPVANLPPAVKADIPTDPAALI